MGSGGRIEMGSWELRLGSRDVTSTAYRVWVSGSGMLGR